MDLHHIHILVRCLEVVRNSLILKRCSTCRSRIPGRHYQHNAGPYPQQCLSLHILIPRNWEVRRPSKAQFLAKVQRRRAGRRDSSSYDLYSACLFGGFLELYRTFWNGCFHVFSVSALFNIATVAMDAYAFLFRQASQLVYDSFTLYTSQSLLLCIATLIETLIVRIVQPKYPFPSISPPFFDLSHARHTPYLKHYPTFPAKSSPLLFLHFYLARSNHLHAINYFFALIFGFWLYVIELRWTLISDK